MANVIINDTHLNNIANSIRNKNGTNTKYKPSEMATAISEITTSENLSTELTEQNTLLSNQSVTIDDIKLALQNKSAGGGEEIVLQEKTITPTTSQQNVVADSSYNGLSKVVINAVDSSIDSDIKASNIKSGVNILGVTGTLVEGITPTGTLNITTNGTHNVTNYASANVNVPSEDLTSELNTYESYLTTQETTIDDIVLALQNKVAGSGSTDIEDALVTRELSGVYINNRVTSIGTEGLRATQISGLHCEEVITVGGEAIRDCKNLVSIYLPKCKTLQGYSVGICPLLERVELNSIETIQAYSFYSCPKLTTFIIRNTSKVCSLANVNAFNSSGISSGTGFVYVPDDLVDDYKSATNWSTYSNQIKGLSELEG